MNRLVRYYWYRKLKHSSYQALFTHYAGEELVSLDCETTSLDPNQAELVSIAATKIIGNRIVTSKPFEVRLRAPQSLDSNSIKIHRIRHQDLKHGVEEQHALKALLDFVGNRPLVGYHIRYDKKILDKACLKHFGFPMPNPLVEVSQLYQEKLEKHLPNAYFDLSLDTICRQLDLPIPTNKHDALQDAISAALIFVRLQHGDLPRFNSSYS